MAMKIQVEVFWVETLCSDTNVSENHVASIFTSSSSETLVYYITTRCLNQEDRDLNTNCEFILWIL
jgi:AraC-like DNA-binding protein